MSPTRDLRTTFVVALALVAMTLKLALAYNTIGTNDAVFFYGFAKVLNEHGLEWTYAHSRYFNHPPLTAYFLRGIFLVTEQTLATAYAISHEHKRSITCEVSVEASPCISQSRHFDWLYTRQSFRLHWLSAGEDKVRTQYSPFSFLQSVRGAPHYNSWKSTD